MKLTIYAMSEDTHREGTLCHIFKSKRELQAHMRFVMERDLDNDDTSHEHNQVRSLLKRGRIAAAWDIYDEHLRDSSDTFAIEERAINIPTTVRIDVLGGVCHLRNKSKAVTVTIKDHDNKPPTIETHQ